MNNIKTFASSALALAIAMAAPLAAAHKNPHNPDKPQAEFNTPAYWYESGQEALAEAKRKAYAGTNAKNVILIVGDGMGVSTVTAARILEGQLNNRDGESNRLAFEQLPHFALSVTASANQQTSDSAPTATAMVAGIKANDGAISVNQTVSRSEKDASVVAAASVKTILEQAEERGMSTGVVSTARVTHATPAVNFAHTPNRDWEADANLPAGATVKDIARQLLEFPYGNGLEVVLGGGRRYFSAETEADPEYTGRTGIRRDGRNLHQEWVSKYSKAAYVWDKKGFDAIDPRKTNHLLGLFEPSHMRYEADRAQDIAGEPSLAEMTTKAIKMLEKNKKGFYLMIEAGRIDHAHHSGNAFRALTDTIALSDAVKAAVAMTDPRETLIVVTADHSHVFTIAGYPERGNPILGKAAVNGVAAKDSLGLPYTTVSYANGPGFTGGFTRREFNGTNESPVPAIYEGGAARPDLTYVDTTSPAYMQEATVPLGSETHAGEDVGLYAQGPNAHLFRGVQEQHVIYHIMADALGLNKRGR
ncbi:MULTISPECIES: alkaline phosphatase [Cellvibrio]|uniref:Alkaline phosphatase n=1 Tax=Cellvibrio fibrivorans TaxID=126350 RepID=A0ABU1V3V3_9GAMM|nr:MULTISPECIES: alkaline phosphatase [Cellvibrio]MDR7092132.1 alkaline phosphatase [Cellvibrio fibrivorans]UUA74417.1 alkaline phosphatase [Cellvibrio sp. QJXJ]